MNPPELNGSSLFLEFGGRKGRPTALTIFNEAASERPPYRSENGGWVSVRSGEQRRLLAPTEREAMAPAERGPTEV